MDQYERDMRRFRREREEAREVRRGLDDVEGGVTILGALVTPLFNLFKSNKPPTDYRKWSERQLQNDLEGSRVYQREKMFGDVRTSDYILDPPRPDKPKRNKSRGRVYEEDLPRGRYRSPERRRHKSAGPHRAPRPRYENGYLVYD